MTPPKSYSCRFYNTSEENQKKQLFMTLAWAKYAVRNEKEREISRKSLMSNNRVKFTTCLVPDVDRSTEREKIAENLTHELNVADEEDKKLNRCYRKSNEIALLRHI